LVAVVVAVSFVRLLYALLVDRQLMDHLAPSGEVTAVRLGDLAGDQLLQVHRDPLLECSHTRGVVPIAYVG
jgi:hypothetical protein